MIQMSLLQQKKVISLKKSFVALKAEQAEAALEQSYDPNDEASKKLLLREDELSKSISESSKVRAPMWKLVQSSWSREEENRESGFLFTFDATKAALAVQKS